MPSKIVNHVMNLRFVTDGRKNGDIEALADARRALKKGTLFKGGHYSREDIN